MAGKVRVPAFISSVLSGSEAVAACGTGAAGTGLIAGGWGSAMAGFGLSGAGWKGGGGSEPGPGFLALKKMSGQCMVVGSCAQFQGIGINLGKVGGFPLRKGMMTPDLNVEVIRKQDRLFSPVLRTAVFFGELYRPPQELPSARRAVAYNVLKRS